MINRDQSPSQYPPEEFIRQAHRSFGFLRDFGFGYTGARSEGQSSTEIFARDRLSVRVQYDQARGDIDVYLIRAAEDGAFPEYLENPQNWISLDKLVEYRERLLGEEPSPMPSLDPDHQVSFRAHQLMVYGGGLLHGNLSVFEEVRAYIDGQAVAEGIEPGEASLVRLIEANPVEGQPGNPQS